MPRKPKPTFVLEMSLITSRQDDARLADRCLVASRITNAGLQDGLAIVEAIRADPLWDIARKMPRTTVEETADRGKAFEGTAPGPFNANARSWRARVLGGDF